MALLKKLTNEKGIVTNYHNISKVTLRDNKLTCFIDSYVSQEYSVAKQNADSSVFMFDITIEEEESMGIRALCYKKIKELDDWKDAADC